MRRHILERTVATMDFIEQPNRIYAVNGSGTPVASISFPNRSNTESPVQLVEINHTFVDDSLRGQGVASKLVEAAVAKLRREHKKAYVTCSYAQKWFQNHPEAADVLAEPTELIPESPRVL
jgi:hypothetical protein